MYTQRGKHLMTISHHPRTDCSPEWYNETIIACSLQCCQTSTWLGLICSANDLRTRLASTGQDWNDQFRSVFSRLTLGHGATVITTALQNDVNSKTPPKALRYRLLAPLSQMQPNVNHSVMTAQQQYKQHYNCQGRDRTPFSAGKLVYVGWPLSLSSSTDETALEAYSKLLPRPPNNVILTTSHIVIIQQDWVPNTMSSNCTSSARNCVQP